MSKNSERLAEQVKPRGAKLALSKKLNVSPSTITRLAKGTMTPGVKLRIALQKMGFPFRGWESETDG